MSRCNSSNIIIYRESDKFRFRNVICIHLFSIRAFGISPENIYNYFILTIWQLYIYSTAHIERHIPFEIDTI